MELNWNYSPNISRISNSDSPLRMVENIKYGSRAGIVTPLKFKTITSEAMKDIWPYLLLEEGRTTDFSYAGILMWVDLFRYEYDIYNDTLFIKGSLESDFSRCAFSLPIGCHPLEESLQLLRDYCESEEMPLEFSAIPEYALPEFEKCSPRNIELLEDWGDYLYDAESLAFLHGKKMGKKRNHVNKFMELYPDWKFEEMTPENSEEALGFMDVFDLEGDSSEMAVAERKLSRDMIKEISKGNVMLKGGILYAGSEICAFTIGDIKRDTLFVHVEKATRKAQGSYEAVNTLFARMMLEQHPDIKYINREDDSGDIGLRMAKESYHPLEILKKYNVLF